MILPRRERAALLVLILSILTSGPASAQSGATLHELKGQVVAEHSKEPIVGAVVELIGLRQASRTDARGRYRFENLPAGEYEIAVTATGYARVTRKVTVPGEVPDITMDLSFHDEPVVVTASPNPRDPLQVYQPTSVLGTHELERRAEASLGMTLQNEPGITTTNLGTAPARPVIRGLGGDRVLILEDGLRTGDVSSLSPDHAVTVDPAAARSVEIVRGPANLLYGGNAMGGVVNVINEDVPNRIVERPTGTVSFSGASDTGELAGSADLTASAGPISMSAGASRHDAGEYRFDGGTAGNSQFDSTSFHGGLAWVGGVGFLGAAYRDYEGDYGIPIAEDGTLLGEGERGVTISVAQESYKLTGELTRDFGPFTAARLQAVRRDYTHTEFEDTGEVGTLFNQETLEARADLTHSPWGKLTGTFGLWYLDGKFEAEGAESILPQADTRGSAGFFYEELAFEKVKWLFGGRYDSQRVDPRTDSDRTFSGVSAALGGIVNPSGPWSVAANVTRNFKAPGAEELFANGPHIATFAFEVGDPDLDEETSVGADLTFRWSSERVSGEVTGFYTDFSDFIFLQLDPNGAVDPGSGLPIALYTQADATFAGFEAHADFSLVEHLELEVLADAVVADNDETEEPLPRIPPYRLGIGIKWDTDRYGLGAEARYGGEQDRVAPNETPTGDFMLYNAFGHVQFTGGRVVHRVVVRGENLTDELYRNHVSLVKDILPQPGRTLRLTYGLIF